MELELNEIYSLLTSLRTEVDFLLSETSSEEVDIEELKRQVDTLQENVNALQNLINGKFTEYDIAINSLKTSDVEIRSQVSDINTRLGRIELDLKVILNDILILFRHDRDHDRLIANNTAKITELEKWKNDFDRVNNDLLIVTKLLGIVDYIIGEININDLTMVEVKENETKTFKSGNLIMAFCSNSEPIGDEEEIFSLTRDDEVYSATLNKAGAVIFRGSGINTGLYLDHEQIVGTSVVIFRYDDGSVTFLDRLYLVYDSTQKGYTYSATFGEPMIMNSTITTKTNGLATIFGIETLVNSLTHGILIHKEGDGYIWIKKKDVFIIRLLIGVEIRDKQHDMNESSNETTQLEGNNLIAMTGQRSMDAIGELSQNAVIDRYVEFSSDETPSSSLVYGAPPVKVDVDFVIKYTNWVMNSDMTYPFGENTALSTGLRTDWDFIHSVDKAMIIDKVKWNIGDVSPGTVYNRQYFPENTIPVKLPNVNIEVTVTHENSGEVLVSGWLEHRLEIVITEPETKLTQYKNRSARKYYDGWRNEIGPLHGIISEVEGGDSTRPITYFLRNALFKDMSHDELMQIDKLGIIFGGYNVTYSVNYIYELKIFDPTILYEHEDTPMELKSNISGNVFMGGIDETWEHVFDNEITLRLENYIDNQQEGKIFASGEVSTPLQSENEDGTKTLTRECLIILGYFQKRKGADRGMIPIDENGTIIKIPFNGDFTWGLDIPLGKVTVEVDKYNLNWILITRKDIEVDEIFKYFEDVTSARFNVKIGKVSGSGRLITLPATFTNMIHHIDRNMDDAMQLIRGIYSKLKVIEGIVDSQEKRIDAIVVAMDNLAKKSPRDLNTWFDYLGNGAMAGSVIVGVINPLAGAILNVIGTVTTTATKFNDGDISAGLFNVMLCLTAFKQLNREIKLTFNSQTKELQSQWHKFFPLPEKMPEHIREIVNAEEGLNMHYVPIAQAKDLGVYAYKKAMNMRGGAMGRWMERMSLMPTHAYLRHNTSTYEEGTNTLTRKCFMTGIYDANKIAAGRYISAGEYQWNEKYDFNSRSWEFVEEPLNYTRGDLEIMFSRQSDEGAVSEMTNSQINRYLYEQYKPATHPIHSTVALSHHIPLDHDLVTYAAGAFGADFKTYGVVVQNCQTYAKGLFNFLTKGVKPSFLGKDTYNRLVTRIVSAEDSPYRPLYNIAQS